MDEHGTIARRLTVHGRVQGVFFRDSTTTQADRRGVRGWVRNDPEGSVTAWLEGEQDAVGAVERWIRRGGPPAARVEDVQAEDVEPEHHDRFEVRH